MRINIQGPFKQIPAKDQSHKYVPIPVWYTIVPAKELAGLLQLLKSKLPTEPYDLTHIRRIVKLEDEKDTTLKLMICSHDCLNLEGVQALLPDYVIDTAEVSQFQADTKEEAFEWSQKSWPIMWRGNPSAVLPTLSDDEQQKMKDWVQKLKDLASNASDGDLQSPDSSHCKGPTATIIVDPVTGDLIGSGTSENRPLGHSIMVATDAVARRERAMSHENPEKEDKGYLCTDMDVYTTHEPCTMCAMALVHSRIGRLIYLTECSIQGAIDPDNQLGYGMHGRRQLNHTYQAWKWNDE